MTVDGRVARGGEDNGGLPVAMAMNTGLDVAG